ncbi:lipoprotein [Actinomycetospora corticicola]|uniref:Sugar lactone lactonase YvrE n=1 Tax=Actinomycetospora corticicola TaxID=663602 RepID=A0A7Y9E1Z3_9PSEU|nr:hypothetical protein [Actinomycetospora corticicola]NYD39693.1 sugar lactone lactonase YvrE [Actinomycetospora corticicola]
MSARRAAVVTVALAALLGACADTPLVVPPNTGAPTSTAAPSATAAPGAGQAPGASPVPAAPTAPPATAQPATSPEATAAPSGRVLDLGDGAATTLTVSPVDQRAVVTLVGSGSGSAATVQVNPDTAAVATRSTVTGSPRAAVPSTDRSGLVLADPSSGLVGVALPSGSDTNAPQGAPTGPQALAVGPAGELLVAATGVAGDARREAAGVDVDGSLTVLRDGRAAGRVGGLGRPVAIAVAGDRVAVLDTARNVVHLVDLATLREQTSVPAGDGPTGVTIDRHGRLLVTDTRAGVIRRYDLSGQSPAPLAPIQLGASTAPYGTAYDATTDRLWVTLTGTDRLVAVDLSSVDQPRVVLDLATIAQPDLIALGTGRVYVASPRTGQLQITLA